MNDKSAFLDHVGEYVSKSSQDQAVRAWMEALGFKWLPFKMWRPPINHPVERNISPEEALFFYTVCQKAEQVARLDENNMAFLRIFQVACTKGLTAERLVKYHDNREAEIKTN